MKKLFLIFLLGLPLAVPAQDPCALLTAPQNGDTDVRLDTAISWTAVPGVNGYLLSIGTAPGANDILDSEMVGSVTTYTPEAGLPASTTIYVTIAPFYFDRPSTNCPPQTFTTETLTAPPDCTQLNDPADGSTGIEYTPLLSWDYAYGAEGYFISAGSTPGGTDFLNMVDAGNATRYNLTQTLPAETIVYVRISPYNRIGVTENCVESIFVTRPAGSAPGCTFLTFPENGAINVALTTAINWEPETEATGYIVNMGYSPGVNDILDNAVFTDPSARVLEFLPNSNVYVTITPFNEAGEAVGCITESFSTTAGCGPFTDPVTGIIIDLNPVISIPDTLAVCSTQDLPVLDEFDPSLSYAWFLDSEEGIRELGNDPFLQLEEAGSYFVEVTDTVQQENNILDCTTIKTFTVIITDPPQLTGADFTETPSGIRLTISVQGESGYEYSINNEEGPFTTEETFDLPEQESYTLYIREPLACGITSFTLNPISFPNFFTPNGDSFNDTWKPTLIGRMQPDLIVVHIFDRYGKLLVSLAPADSGWDGTYNGHELPASDYWYSAEFNDGTLKKGHFSLKR